MDSIKNLIVTKNISVKITDSLSYALNVMAKNQHGVVVVLSDNLPIGILTERDILNILDNDIDFTLSVKSFLRFNHLITINMKRSVDYAIHVLIDNNIRRLIVVDENNNFIGITTQDMLVKHLEDDNFKKNLMVSDFYTEDKELVSVEQNKTIAHSFKMMNDKNIGSIVVLDIDNNPVGMLTERDAVHIANSQYNLNDAVSNVMTTPIVTICESSYINEVIAMMDIQNIRRVAVTKKNSKEISFILSIRDIANNLKGNFGTILESKLKNVKNTLNYIGESVLEIYEDNDEKVIQWINDTALKNFGNILDKNLLTIIGETKWNEIYKEIKITGTCEKVKIKIQDMYFEMICSRHYVNKKESLLIILRDISEFEYAVIDANKKQEELSEELNILQGVIDQQKTIVFVTDGFKIKSANKSLYTFFNLNSFEEFMAKYVNISETFINVKNFFSLENEDDNWIDEIMKIDVKKRIVSILDLNSFEPKAFTVQVNPLSSDHENYAVTLTDITEIKLESQQYHFHATHDALTSIYNRSYYFEKIANEIEQAKRYDISFCIILFDIDHFKKFNDKYGHLKGDEVLVSLAKTVKEHTRASDTFARWGGEEFIILLEQTTIDKAELIAEHFRKLIETMNIPDIEQVTSSFGVTQFKAEDNDNSILKRADDALYMAKESGRNKVVII